MKYDDHTVTQKYSEISETWIKSEPTTIQDLAAGGGFV